MATRNSSAGLVVGVVASAGGLQPLKDLLAATPPNSGLAFVIVEHLDPNRPSLLPELLQSVTDMPVAQATEGAMAAPNTVHVIPPKARLVLRAGLLHVTPLGPGDEHSILLGNELLQSLASAVGARAVGVVLSGTGHDGTEGLRAIREAGGHTVAQEPETASSSDMPTSAIAAGVVDSVLAPAAIAEGILAHAARRGAHVEHSIDERAITDRLEPICAILARKTGHDFRQYKPGTLVRRIRHRMLTVHAVSVAAYESELLRSETEASLLLQDLLIGVTQFFRDPPVFEYLNAHVIPVLCQGPANTPVRIWVAGCASGEEAYSLAILVREHMARIGSSRPLLVFATDIDTDALMVARSGRYAEDAVDGVSSERLASFFVREGAYYRVVKDLREACLFSTQNLVRDPPFSNLDLISCRNVLIYLQAELQKKLVPLFHYGLKPGGFLCLGMSESLPSNPDLFEPLDKSLRVFRRREVLTRHPIDFPLMGGNSSLPATATPSDSGGGRPAQSLSGHSFERMLLEEYTPASAIVNESGEILYRAGRGGSFFRPFAGTPSNNLLDQLRGNLRRELAAALRQAAALRRRVIRDDVLAEVEVGVQRLRLTVRPLPGMVADSGMFAVVIQELEPPHEPEAPRTGEETQQSIVDHLEHELRLTRTELHATVEELESSNEELKCSNEELLSTNEELQSANEELQTSQEELKGVNQELQEVNAELQSKLRELRVANDDLKNLFASTQVATVFLDRELRVSKFTPAATSVFRLRDSDLGRPIADLAPAFAGADFVADARQVLASLLPIERQVHTPDGAHWFIVRTMAYRTLDDTVAGVVTTFMNVTELKQAERLLKRQAELLRSSFEPILTWWLDDGIEFWNRGAEELYGYSAAEVQGRSSHQLLHTILPQPMPELLALLRREGRWEGELQHRTRSGEQRTVLAKFQLIREEDGRELVLETNRDITERARVAGERRRLAALYHSISSAQPTIVYTYNSAGELVDANPTFADLLGRCLAELTGQRAIELLPATARTAALEADRQMRGGAGSSSFEMGLGDRHFLCVVSALAAQGQQLGEFVTVGIDVSLLKQAQEALRLADQRKTEFLAMLSHELRAPLTPIRNGLFLLEKSPPDSPTAARARAIICRQVDHLSRLVDDLLDMARVVRGVIRVEKWPIDLSEVVRQVVQDHEALFASAQVSIELTGAEEPLWVDGDRVRLAQVLTNLLTNAAKFSNPGGQTTVSLAREDARAVLRVRDSGQGIPPEVLPRLFEIFAQADTSLDRSCGGLGLGLALAKALVTLHGGTITASSAGAGRGSEFVVTLPALQAEQPPSPPPSLSRVSDRRRVLYIEDNRDTAESLLGILDLLGHEGHAAYTGEQGIEQARKLKPDVILCDIGLPGIDGYQVARTLRADPLFRHVQLVALTGYAQPEDVERAKEAGFDVHLSKPPPIEKLQACLNSKPQR